MGIEGTGQNPEAHTNIGDSQQSEEPSAFSDEIFQKGLKAFFGGGANAAFMKEGIHFKIIRKVKTLIKPATAKQAKKM
jgi:hypothetical protein